MSNLTKDMTSGPDYKVTVLFEIKYLKHGAR